MLLLVTGAAFRHSFGILPYFKHEVMNQYEVPALIADKFPETNGEIFYHVTIGNIYQTMFEFSRFMRKKVMVHQFSKVFKWLRLADYIYAHGNTEVKNAVESAFIYSFSQTSQCCNKKEWALVKAHIPARLYTIYITQVIGYGS